MKDKMVEIPDRLVMILRWTAIILIILNTPLSYIAFSHYNLSVLWWEVAVCFSSAAAGWALGLYLMYNYGWFIIAIVLPIIGFSIFLVTRIIAIKSEKIEDTIQKTIPWIGMVLALLSGIITGAGLAQWSKIVTDGIIFILLDLNIITALNILTIPWTLPYVGMGFSISACAILVISEIKELFFS
ncbi:MAG: hypothetical protein HWN67_05290 [Candidatus Helarchaeota archaeon]|nr:hypothetical protein [Candidatus Helarchaeota archaeon]